MSVHGSIGRAAVVASLVLWLSWGPVNRAFGARLTPDSPEVQKAVKRAIEFLASDEGKYERLGGKALIGIAFLKSGSPATHPRIDEAVRGIQERLSSGSTSSNYAADGDGEGSSKGSLWPIYDLGLSIIFLVTLDSAKYAAEIESLLSILRNTQKPHGGWGYPDKETGDTSMTQYAVLSSWEAAQAGFRVPREMIEGVADWLLRTQDPSGGFGYQGIPSDGNTRIKQGRMRHSLVAAGLGSVYVCANLLGFSEKIDQSSDLPKSVREVKARSENVGPGSRIDAKRIRTAQMDGNAWMRTNFEIDPPQWTYYYLYGLERYRSFRESAEGEKDQGWYHEGVRFLIRNQRPDGSWSSNKEKMNPIDTAFGTLFLLRSTKKSIEHAKYFRASVMVSGRGMPEDMTRVKLAGGRVIPHPTSEQAAAILDQAADRDHPEHVRALEILGSLPAEEAKSLVDKHRDRVREMATGGVSPEVRRAAVRVLGNTNDLRHVPPLIAALNDPDFMVVREANQGLMTISRKLRGYELTERSSPATRAQVIEKWKAWYWAVYPDAEFTH
jgi:hypothetical protein